MPAALAAYIGIARDTILNPLTAFGPKGVDAYVSEVNALLDRHGLDARHAFVAALRQAAMDKGLDSGLRDQMNAVAQRLQGLDEAEERHRRSMIEYGRRLAMAGAIVDHTYSGPQTVAAFRAMEASQGHEDEMRRLRERVVARSSEVYTPGVTGNDQRPNQPP